MNHRLYIVDVFAEQSYAGNQLAVVIAEEALSSETMQRFAAEMNFSETTFVMAKPDVDGGYPVRVFTPAREIAFTGHPILGTAWVVRHYLAAEPYSQIRLNLAVGQVPVSFETDADGREIAWFLAPPMTLEAATSAEPVAAALGISTQEIDSGVPVQVISAGTSALIVPVCSLDALQRSRLDLGLLAPLLRQGFPPLVYLFCQQTRNPRNDLSARFFFEAHGVREDPATGNGAAFLGAYLLQHRILPEAELSLRIEQGHEVNRPSLILLRAKMRQGVRDVRVGGYVMATVEGVLL
ncbi:MAG: PhzF family phenazine biosynthesis protein [Candidatus Thiodiazotropha sp.]